MFSEFADRASDHAAAVVGSFWHLFAEIGNVLYEPWTALGNSPTSTLPCGNFNGRATVENEIVSIRS